MEYKRTISIKAKMKVLPKGKNEGRETPIKNGYRPNDVFEYIQAKMLQSYIGEIRFTDFETIAPQLYIAFNGGTSPNLFAYSANKVRSSSSGLSACKSSICKVW